jgi:hypothetical protein
LLKYWQFVGSSIKYPKYLQEYCLTADEKKVDSHYHKSISQKLNSNQENSEIPNDKKHINSIYKSEMTNMIDLSCGNEEKLCSAIEKMKKRLLLNEGSLIFPNNLNSDFPKTWLVLANWLRFINMVVLEFLDLIEPFCNENLSNWIIDEFKNLLGFSSITGSNKTIKKQMNEALEILVQQLKLKQVKFHQEAFKIAFSIMKIWYQNVQPEIWEKLGNFDHSSPELNMLNQILSQAVLEGIMVDQNSNKSYQLCELDKLKIPLIDVFPESMKPKSFALRFKDSFLEEEKVMQSLMKTFFWLDSNRNSDYSIRNKIEIKGTSINMHQYRSTRIYRTRINIKSVKDVYQGHFIRKIKFLLWHLIMCHTQLLTLQYEKGMEAVPNSMIELKEWFHEVLFGTKYSHLPIFGDVDSEKVEFTISSFGPVQIYLINYYLNDRYSNSKVNQVSLALICYWYQKFYPEFFFKNEKKYWKNMIERLGIMLNFTGRYNLNFFNLNGKWIGP